MFQLATLIWPENGSYAHLLMVSARWGAGTFQLLCTGLAGCGIPICWIGRGDPILWPPRSEDLSPLDFFLWGHQKELVYRDVITSESELVARFHAAITFVNTDLLQRVQLSIPKRLNAFLEMRHFEDLPI